MILRAPGVYRPQGDTHLLAEALALSGIPAGGSALDIGTGTGAMAIAAARAGAAEVTAVDVSRRAVWTARANAALRGVPVRVLRGDALDVVAGRRFDLVLSNPPYVPAPSDSARGRARAWDAGPDGRAMVDRICAAAPDLLAPDGVLLMVHSALCDVDATLSALRDGGLKAAVVARSEERFGPVMRSRAGWLRGVGLIADGQREEELLVVRADAPRLAARGLPSPGAGYPRDTARADIGEIAG